MSKHVGEKSSENECEGQTDGLTDRVQTYNPSRFQERMDWNVNAFTTILHQNSNVTCC